VCVPFALPPCVDALVCGFGEWWCETEEEGEEDEGEIEEERGLELS
jgi:hypothetical protein